jgi:SAM-dependent methyltransferase
MPRTRTAPRRDAAVRTVACAAVLALALVAPSAGAQSSAARDCADRYSTRANAAPGGTGRVHLGREIAPVMSHLGAGWLERPEREQEERASIAIRELRLRPNDVVADLGAGSGWYSVRLARQVPQGRVLAVDVQPEMLALVRAQAARAGLANIEPVLAGVDDPRLPAAGVDVVLMVDVYHELSQPCEVMQGVARALKPGGRVALIEFRGEDPAVPILPLHKMTRAQVDREMAAAGFERVRSFDALPWQHLLIYAKR